MCFYDTLRYMYIDITQEDSCILIFSGPQIVLVMRNLKGFWHEGACHAREGLPQLAGDMHTMAVRSPAVCSLGFKEPDTGIPLLFYTSPDFQDTCPNNVFLQLFLRNPFQLSDDFYRQLHPRLVR